MNRLEMVEALRLSENRIRGIRQELERLERKDVQLRYLEEKRK